MDQKASARRISHGIGRVMVLHRLHVQRSTAPYHLYGGQLPILDFIGAHDGCTQKDVADFMQVSPPSIATSVKRMQKAGLLEKVSNERDLRCNRLSLTEEGERAVTACKAGFDAVTLQMLDGFSSEEREALSSYIGRMIRNLSTEEYRSRNIFSLLEEEKVCHAKQQKEGAGLV